MGTDTEHMDRIRTTFRLPRTLHKAIQREAVDTERGMTEIIVEQLSTRYETPGETRSPDGQSDGRTERQAA